LIDRPKGCGELVQRFFCRRVVCFKNLAGMIVVDHMEKLGACHGLPRKERRTPEHLIRAFRKTIATMISIIAQVPWPP